MPCKEMSPTEVSGIIATHLILLVAILLFVFISQEEMQRGTLRLDDRVEASLCDDGHSLGIAPNALPPQLLRQDDRPHGFLARLPALRCEIGHLGLALVAGKLSTDPPLDHAKEHGLYGVVQLVVLGAQVGGLDIVQDGFADEHPKI